MNRNKKFWASGHWLWLLLTLILLGCGSSKPVTDPGESRPDPEQIDPIPGDFRILLFSETAGFRHASIEVGRAAIQQLGTDNGFAVDTTEDSSNFNAANLAQYAAVLFLNTTGDVLSDEEQDAFETYITSGGGYVGIHSAADTEYDWPLYGELVGAYFLTHPVANQPGSLRIEDDTHPSTGHLPRPWMLPLEEFYSFQSSPRGETRILLNVDESSYQQTPNISCDPSGPTFPNGFSGTQGDHPMAWCHDKFAGRAWYTALGHEAALYQDPNYMEHVLNGIMTATRRVAATCAVVNDPNAPAFMEPVLEPCQNQLFP